MTKLINFILITFSAVPPFGDFFGYDVSLAVDCKMLYLKKYNYDNGYLVEEDVVFRKDANKRNCYFFAMYTFDTLYNVKEKCGNFIINKLVSREDCYNGEKFIRKEPIYYGENYNNINNMKDEMVLRKVLTK